jgi:hypothetical protein
MFNLKKLLILIGQNILISLMAVLVAFFSIVFIKNEIERITNTIILNHKLEVNLKNKIELSSKIKQDVQIVGKNDILIENAFVPSDNISNFINALDTIASSNSIIQTYRFESPIPSNILETFPLSTISYSNDLATDIKTFSNYLKSYEKLPYFTKIESLDISSQDKTGWLGVSNISIKATLLTKTIQ